METHSGVRDSQQRLLEVLERRGSASVRELSEALGLTQVTIRYHLQALLVEGYVAEPEPRPKPGRGRPGMIYSPAPRANQRMPRNFGELCAGLLRETQRRLARSQFEESLRRAGAGLAASAPPVEGSGWEADIARTLPFLADRGYLATGDRGPDSFHLRFANCPYHELAREDPVVCAFDLGLVEALTRARVELRARIADNAPACLLDIRPSALLV
jgi:predicted ArsR family transcriptional regulator